VRLRQRLGLPPSTPLQLTSALDDASRAHPAVQPRERVPVQRAREAVEASRAGVQGARAGHYPSLDLSMSYGKVSYPDQPLSSSDWRTNWTITALASWPLFEGFRTRGEELAAQAELGQTRVRLAQIEKQAAYESEQVVLQLRAAEAVLAASAATSEQARQAYAIAELRFQEGISTQLELSDARLALAQSETNRARAVRDVRVARVRLALLPELPLSAAAALGATLSSEQAAPRTANTFSRDAGAPVSLEPSLTAMPAAAASVRGF
jgi:outer membrane protein